MKDDWSIKNKRHYLKYDGHSIYSEQDLETLRQKLIEDVKSLKPITDLEGDLHEGFHYGFEDAIAMIKIILDKRFGVE